MIFKFTDLENKVTKSLISFRNKEVDINESNAKAVPKLVKASYDGVYGNGSQQSCVRTNTYKGFKFTEPDTIDPKVFKQKDIDGESVFMPNARTKVGREMKNALNNLPCTTVFNLFDLILCVTPYAFTYPYLELFNGILYLFVDDNWRDFSRMM